MNRREWYDSQHALRTLLRGAFKKPGDDMPDRLTEYKFGVAWNPQFRMFHVYDGAEEHMLSTVRIADDRCIVRYNPGDMYAHIIEKIEAPNRQTILVETDTLERHEGWVHNRLHSRIRRSIEDFLVNRRQRRGQHSQWLGGIPQEANIHYLRVPFTGRVTQSTGAIGADNGVQYVDVEFPGPADDFQIQRAREEITMLQRLDPRFLESLDGRVTAAELHRMWMQSQYAVDPPDDYVMRDRMPTTADTSIDFSRRQNRWADMVDSIQTTVSTGTSLGYGTAVDMSANYIAMNEVLSASQREDNNVQEG